MKKTRNSLIAVCAILSLLFVAGCVTKTTRTYSSVVEYLYPGKAEPVEKVSIPVLTLPVKVGVAFVPDVSTRHSGKGFFGPHQGPAEISEQEKMDLMNQITDNFLKYPFVNKSIELIPSQYLTSGGSFTNLDQIRTMYGIDVIVLLSYDQVQFTDEGFLSLTYWTLVGAYVVKGEKNSTRTMMDAAVYHIPSRKMLFRAPGTSGIKSSATPVNLSERLREDTHKGFQEAATNLVSNLQTQLTLFQERVKTSPQDVRVVHGPQYRGGGSFGSVPAVLLACIGGYLLWYDRKRRK